MEKQLDNVIEIQHLNKTFGNVHAVNDLSFQVRKGELFAFLGVNGAGKSTTISIICGQLKKDSGVVKIGGDEVDKKPADIKRMVGVVFQDSVLDKPLTVKENLESRAALYGITGKAFDKRLEELSNILDFKEFMNRQVGKLSGGQRRRIDIARALLHKPEILILDEPTTGLDPQTRKLIWNIIEKLRVSENMTVFLTTHYMEEAASAGYVVILDKGQIVAEGTPYQLKNQYVQDYVSIYGVREEQIQKLDKPYKEIRDGYQIQVKNTSEATKMIVENQELFSDYEVVKGGMDDVFLAVTGKVLGGENQ
nr:ABC transporter ATP-binding protein [uncultured Blautia sp.]